MPKSQNSQSVTFTGMENVNQSQYHLIKNVRDRNFCSEIPYPNAETAKKPGKFNFTEKWDKRNL